MHTPMKPLFTRERAMHFLKESVVHSMEGVLFVLLSTLFTLAGAAAFLEDSRWFTGVDLTASAPAPAAPAIAERPPPPVATVQQASYVLPEVR
jgi:hypothetical protein